MKKAYIIGALAFMNMLSSNAEADLSKFAGKWRSVLPGCVLQGNTTLEQNDRVIEVNGNQLTWIYDDFFDYPTFEPNKVRTTKIFPLVQELKTTFVPLEVPESKRVFVHVKISNEVIRDSGRLILRETVTQTSVTESEYNNKFKNVPQVYAGGLPSPGVWSTIIEADGVTMSFINPFNNNGCKRVRVSSF